MNCNYFIVRLL